MQEWASDENLLQLIKQLDIQNNGMPTETEVSASVPRAWLKVENGQIHMIGLENRSEGDWPVIEAVPPIRLTVNGEAVHGPIRVKPGDKIDWSADQKSFRIDVSPDKMKAWLLMLPDGRNKLRLVDEEKTDRLVLRAVEDPDAPMNLPGLQTILQAIQDLGILHYDLPAIMKEIHTPTYAPILLGKGQEPVPGTDAALELFFNENIEISFEEVNGAVDFRNYLKIPSVRKGDRIARKVPPSEGIPGYNVFGEIIPAPHPKDFILLGRQNVRVEGNEAFAEKDGRPRVTGQNIKFIDITTAHVIPGDVDLTTGNIVFAGDVHVYGNVTDGMIVEALGNVYVGGNVYRATITATGSIHVKGNTVGSKLYSGHYGVLFNRMFHNATKLNERLGLYRQMADQLMQLAAERGQAVTDRQVHYLLMENKFKDVPELCHNLLGCIFSLQSIQKNTMNELKHKLETLASPYMLQQGEVQTFMLDLQERLVTTIESIRRSEETEVCTDIQQCHLTEIMSNGDILIRRQGVLQSRLSSKKNIIFFQRDSVCRGSELEAELTISAMIVGGVSGGSTKLKAGKKVLAAMIYEGKVVVGKFSKEILEPVENVCFQVKDNRLIIESIPNEPKEIRHVAHEAGA